MLIRLLLASLLLVPSPAPFQVPAAFAEGGPALITVSGAVGKPNRGPLDPFLDELLARYVESFDKARTFDLADLQALPQHELIAAFPEWQGASHRFEGPLVADLLAAAGATGTKVTFIAIDGYVATRERAVLDKAAFILAIKIDGQPLGLGGHGPAWLIVSPDIEPAFPDGKPSLDGLVWAVFHIVVE
ncbi:MAG TPA: hypothetical protein VJL84_04880 [Kiloniellales bacterium]|nr:hypothetical protein [Kiloniellales bacterium]